MINENENPQENQLLSIDRINPCYSTINLDEWKARIFEGYNLNEYLDGYEEDSLEKLEDLQTYIDQNPGRYSCGSSGIAKHSGKILKFLEDLTGDRYEYHTTGWTYNSETDLSNDFVYDIFAPADSGDWIWSPDVVVIIDGTEWYKLDFLGDSGFFDRTIGYYATDLTGEHVEVPEIETGYSSYPYGQISDLYVGSKHEPILKWSDKFQGFLARHESLGETHILRPYLHVGS